MSNVIVSSLSNRLLRIVSICASLYLLVTLAIMVPSSFKQADAEHLELEEKLVLSLSNSASIALYVNNREIAEEVMTSLLMHEEINGVKLVGMDGTTFEKVKAGVYDQNIWLQVNEYPLFSPIDGQPLGFLYIHDNQAELNKQTLEQVIYQVLFILLQFLVTFVALVMVVQHIIGKPLTNLSKTLAQAKPGHTEKMLVDEANKNNEIGLVVGSVNQFIESSHQALERERELRSQIERWELYYRNMAERDTLTGLKNRLGCEKYVNSVIPHSSFIALLLIDLDGFKSVNDSFGHAAGDAVLTTLAKRFTRQQKMSELPGVVGRIGGDEFVVYLALNYSSVEQLALLAESIIEATNQPIEYQHHTLYVGCSIGVVESTVESFDNERMMHRADLAMYEVKQAHKNSFRFYMPERTMSKS